MDHSAANGLFKGWLKLLFALFLLVLPAGCSGGGGGGADTVTQEETAAEPGSTSSVGGVYYVSPAGSNSNPGTLNAPFATPGYASRLLAPGDTLIILGGRYSLSVYDDDIITPPSGTASAWITIRGEEGNRPVLAGSGDLLTAIDIGAKSYIAIENIEITNDNGALFRQGIEGTSGPVSHVILRDLYIHHVDEFGINIGDADDLRIQDSVISYCGFGAVGGPEGAEGGWRNVTISSCELSYSGHYYRGGDGSDRPYDRPDGFGIEPSAGPVEIVDTVAKHNRGDGLDSKAANTTVRRCRVENNSCDGVKLWATGSRIENTLIYGRGDGDAARTPWAAIVIDEVHDSGASFEITNVTVDDFAGGSYLMYVQYSSLAPVSLTVRNTIFSARGEGSPIYIGASVSLAMNNNLFYFPASDFAVEAGGALYGPADVGALGPGNIHGDPLFENPAFGSDGNYRLRAASPAIDAGSSDGAPSNDLDGAARPRGAGVDIGAYER